MQKIYSLVIALLLISASTAQEIYVVNNVNEIKIINVDDFSVTDLFGISIQEAGFITDLAFTPDGRLFGVTNIWTIIEIDLINETFSQVVELPTGDAYTALVSNSSNELFTSRYLNQELYKYNLDTGETTFVENDISTPGDYTFYKGNLVYPSFFNDFIKSYDGVETSNIGCSVPLIWTFVNQFEDCENNTIYALDQFAKLYRYDLETEDYEFITDLVSETGPLYGGATTTEYMASDCPVAVLEEVSCEVLSAGDFNPYGIETFPNPITDVLYIRATHSMEGFSFRIHDMRGILIASGPVPKIPSIPLNVPSGLYFLEVIDVNGMSVFQEKLLRK